MRQDKNAQCNANWLARDYRRIKEKQSKIARDYKNSTDAKSPSLALDDEGIKWKRPSKHG